MTKFVPLYSGSSGNSTAVVHNGRVLLVDIGCSCRKTVGALYSIGQAASEVEAILLTHEHSDHIGGLSVFLRHYPVPVYGTAGTLSEVERLCSLPADTELRVLSGEEELCGMGVRSFATPHDSRECCGFRFSLGRQSAAIATDIGHMTQEVYDNLLGCQAVLLESNYDEGLLMMGRYPYPLKQRIRSDYGHLSNYDCADTLSRLVQAGAEHIRLMHLSAENNTPQMALTTAAGALENIGAGSVDLLAACRSEPTEAIVL